MSWRTRVFGLLVLGVAVAGPVRAQEKAVTISVRGGGFNSLTNLNDAGTADLKEVGYDVGGSVGVDLFRYLAVRGDFTFARNELRENEVETGQHLNRYFFDGALQVQYPTSSGVQPYAFVGAGGVALHPAGTSGFDETKFAGTGGLGVSYTIPGTGLALFVEGQSWLYKLSGLSGSSLNGFDKTQYDVAWSAGVSYRIPARSAGVAQANR